MTTTSLNTNNQCHLTTDLLIEPKKMPFINKDHTHEFVFEGDDLRDTRWTVSYNVCTSPTCSDLTLELQFNPVRGAHTSELDVHTVYAYFDSREVVDKENPEERTFADAVAKELTSEDWHLLHKRFAALKQRLYENVDLTDQDFDFPFDKIEDEGLKIAYNDVLPFHNPLNVTVEDHCYRAIDQHCVIPRCPCTEVNVSFFEELSEPESNDKEVDEEFTVTLNFKRQRSRIEATYMESALPQKRIMDAFLDQFGYELMAERNRTLKKLYQRNRNKQFAPVTRASEKIGRNEPCPCGSGKKYKKCCGRA